MELKNALSLTAALLLGHLVALLWLPHANVLAQSDSKMTTLRLQKLELLDSQGKLRASLECTKAFGIESPSLRLFDNSGNVLAMLAITPNQDQSEQPQLAILDKSGNKRIALFTRDTTGPTLYMYGKDGRMRAGVEVSSDNSSQMTLRYADGRMRLAAGSIQSYDPPKSGKYDFELVRHLNHSIETYDASGKLRWSAP